MEIKQNDNKWWKDLLHLRDELMQKMSREEMAVATMGDKSAQACLAYDCLSAHSPLVPWWQMVWHEYNLPKASFITWLVLLGRAQTRDRVSVFKPAIERRCVLCDVCDESISHLFFHCWRR